MKEKLNKSHLSAMVKKSTTFDGEIDINDDLSFDGYFKDKFMQKKEQEISLKSIYNLIIKNQENNNERFNSIDNKFISLENEIRTIKEDIISVKQDVNNLDTKLNKVIELNKDIINLNRLKVSKENKTWLFGNGDNNTPSI